MTVDTHVVIEIAQMKPAAEMGISIEEVDVPDPALEAPTDITGLVETVAIEMMQMAQSLEMTAAIEMKHDEQVEVQREKQPLL